MNKHKWSVFITVGVSIESNTELTDDELARQASTKLFESKRLDEIIFESDFEIVAWDKDEIAQWDKETSNGETQA